jgi:hypothetical protein
MLKSAHFILYSYFHKMSRECDNEAVLSSLPEIYFVCFLFL